MTTARPSHLLMAAFVILAAALYVAAATPVVQVAAHLAA